MKDHLLISESFDNTLPMSALNASRHIKPTKELATSNPVIEKRLKSYSDWFFDERDALRYKGHWKNMFQNDNPIDLEIGIGSGWHFSNYCRHHPNRNLIGIDLQYKPLLQSLRRIKTKNINNAIVVRYHGSLLQDLFEKCELSDVFMYFLDPWPKKKHFKNRLIQNCFLKTLSSLQKIGGCIYFKTDHPAYFEWTKNHIENSNYNIDFCTRDLFNSSYYQKNISTQFEDLWVSKGLNIHFLSATNQ